MLSSKSLQITNVGDLQDGGGVRCGDHLSPHKYIRNTSTCGKTPTKHLLNTDRRPQTSQKARNSPPTRVGQKKKTDKRIGKGPAPLGGRCEGGKVSTHQETLSLAETGSGGGEALEPQRRVQQQGCRGQRGEIPTQRIGADEHLTAREACLLTC